MTETGTIDLVSGALIAPNQALQICYRFVPNRGPFGGFIVVAAAPSNTPLLSLAYAVVGLWGADTSIRFARYI